MFQVCSLNQLFNTGYNTNIVKKQHSKNSDFKPKFVGIIEFEGDWIKIVTDVIVNRL